jgi:hypothetical protein
VALRKLRLVISRDIIGSSENIFHRVEIKHAGRSMR